jgi:predicted nucleic acid-binding protein
MAVVDASVYVALIHEDEPGHADSWAWLQAVQARG